MRMHIDRRDWGAWDNLSRSFLPAPDADFATPYTPLSDGPLLDNRRTPS